MQTTLPAFFLAYNLPPPNHPCISGRAFCGALLHPQGRHPSFPRASCAAAAYGKSLYTTPVNRASPLRPLLQGESMMMMVRHRDAADPPIAR